MFSEQEQEQKHQVELLKSAALSNPDDMEVQWKLYNHYLHGWGVQANPFRAESHLARAAKGGHSQAKLELERRGAEDSATRDQVELDSKRKSEAQSVFDKKAGLLDAIKTEIFPSLFSIRTAHGVIGMGFFQHCEWLVSNAHIVPFKEVLGGMKLIGSDASEKKVVVETSYHRPSNKNDSPDVVIIKTENAYANKKCLPTQFSGDSAHEKTYLFYVNLNASSSGSYEINFLRQRSTGPNLYPLIYECEGGVIPQPGSSGTPIIEARVALGGQPSWQFNVVGVLYARCSPLWYRKNFGIEAVSESTKLVCAIPVSTEFSQILKHLYTMERAERESLMSRVSEGFKDEKGKKDVRKYSEASFKSTLEGEIKLREFEAGVTYLNILLPDGLERLAKGKLKLPPLGKFSSCTVGLADQIIYYYVPMKIANYGLYKDSKKTQLATMTEIRGHDVFSDGTAKSLYVEIPKGHQADEGQIKPAISYITKCPKKYKSSLRVDLQSPIDFCLPSKHDEVKQYARWQVQFGSSGNGGAYFGVLQLTDKLFSLHDLQCAFFRSANSGQTAKNGKARYFVLTEEKGKPAIYDSVDFRL